MLKLYIH